MRRSRGFTLVELLTVVAIIGIVMAFAATYMRPNQAERIKSGARSLLGMAHEARQTAISTRQSVRMKLGIDTVNGTYHVSMETRDPGTGGIPGTTWNTLGGTLRLSKGVQLCTPDGSTVLTAATPTCPIASTTYVCISPNGYVNKVDDGACDDNVSSANSKGATMYLRTSDGQNQFKVMIWGLTGLPKLVDTWSR